MRPAAALAGGTECPNSRSIRNVDPESSAQVDRGRVDRQLLGDRPKVELVAAFGADETAKAVFLEVDAEVTVSLPGRVVDRTAAAQSRSATLNRLEA